MNTNLRAVFLFVVSLFLMAERVVAQSPAPKPAENQAVDDEAQKLIKARHEEAAKELAERIAMSRDVRYSLHPLFDVEQRFLQSGLEWRTKAEDRVAFLADHVKTLKSLEDQIEARFKGGAGSRADLHMARYYRLNAELQLVRAKREADKANAK